MCIASDDARGWCARAISKWVVKSGDGGWVVLQMEALNEEIQIENFVEVLSAGNR